MITIGTDPEFFLQDATGPVAVCGNLGGRKGKPIPIGDDGMFGLQEDNVMVEWNTPPAQTAYDFADLVKDGLREVVGFVRTKMPGVEPMRYESTVLFPDAQLVHPKALEFGCSPDFDAYERGAACDRIDPAQLVRDGGALRFAGGHVHIGYDNPNDIPEFVVASFADLFLGLVSIEMGDNQGERRGLYGAPGRYRPTAYGIEYRVLSNFWIWDYDSTATVGIGAVNLGHMIETWNPAELQRVFKQVPWNDVRAAIATENAILASRLRAYCRRDLDLEV